MKNPQDLIDFESLSSNLFCIKNIIETRQYCIHSCAMDAIINSDQRLSTTAGKLWSFLRTMVNSDPEWSIMISNAALAKKIDRSVWTIRRLLNELERCCYIYRQFNNGKMSKIYVRFPQEFLDKIEKETRPRNRSKCTTPGKMLGGQKARSYYLYNTNNNNSPLLEPEPLPPIESEIVVIAAAQKIEESSVATETERTIENPVAIETKKEPKIDNVAKIEKLEIRKKEISKEFTQAMIEKNYQKMKELGEIDANLYVEIERLKHVPKPVPEDHNKKKRKISEYDWGRIHKEISSYKLNINIQRLMEEIDFSVRQGSLRFSKFDKNRENTVEHGWNIGLQLIREGKWQTPREMFRR